MKQFFCISFSIIIFGSSLFPKSDMEELFKVPFLINHYFTEHADLNFWDFLAIHYSSPEGQHKDPYHQKLPLKHHHHEGLQYFDLMILDPVSLTDTYSYLHNFQVSIYSIQYQFTLSTEIYHPPMAA